MKTKISLYTRNFNRIVQPKSIGKFSHDIIGSVGSIYGSESWFSTASMLLDPIRFFVIGNSNPELDNDNINNQTRVSIYKIKFLAEYFFGLFVHHWHALILWDLVHALPSSHRWTR